MKPTPTLLTIATALALAAPTLGTQQTLQALQEKFAKERDDMLRKQRGQVTFEHIKEIAGRHAGQLEKFLAGDVTGTDRVNGRLMLTNIYLDVGEEEKARATLGALETGQAPALELVTAAEMAQLLGMQEKRDAWVDLALKIDSPFEERMALGMVLMTRLLEVDRGERLFARALKAAKDDEQKAKVMWYIAEATSHREDLSDGAYEAALAAIEKDYPDSYFGEVAADRLRAMAFRIGDPAIPLNGKDLSGKAVSLSDFAGKVVLLHFWGSWARESAEIADVLVEARNDFGDKGLVMLGVAIDEDRAQAAAAAKEAGMDWRHIFDGKVWMTDAALRYSVQNVPSYVLIGKDGKVAGLRMFLRDENGVGDFRQLVENALK